jgi:hypothetical protein
LVIIKELLSAGRARLEVRGSGSLCDEAWQRFLIMPVVHRASMINMDTSPLSALDQIIDLRRALSGEVEQLAQKRAELQAQLDAQLAALGKKLKEVDVELEAKRRTLKLVWATEQQLTAQGQPGLHEGGPADVPSEAGTEVRRGDTADQPVLV